MMIKTKAVRIIPGLLACFAVVMAIGFSKSLAKGCLYGIQICLNSLIPSLFFFMALSSFLMQSGIGHKMFYPLCHPLSKMFHIEKKYIPIFCFSLLGGYPIGPKLIADAICKKEMDSKIGTRMLAFCVNCGPAFLISAVSVPIFHNYRIGLIVYLSQILSAFFIGCLLGRKKTSSPLSNISTQNQQYDHQSFSNEFVTAVQTSVKSMALICAFVVVFTGISQILKDTGIINAISSLLQYVMTKESANCLVVGLLEVTSGCAGLSGSPSMPLFILFTGFGGICVHIQTKAILNKAAVKMNLFYLLRPVYILLSYIFSMFFIRLCGGETAVFQAQDQIIRKNYTASPISSVLLVILSIALLLSNQKSDTIETNQQLSGKE